MARPSTCTPGVVDTICDRLSEGVFLAEICRGEGMPGLRTVYDWAEADPAVAAQIARARKAGFDVLAVNAVNILDEPPRMVETKYGEQVDSGDVALRRARFDGRLKLLSKWDPRYADKLEVENKGTMTLNVAVKRFTPDAEETSE